MSKRYIRAILRGATAVGLLAGWDGPFVDDSYCLSSKAPAGDGRSVAFGRRGRTVITTHVAP